MSKNQSYDLIQNQANKQTRVQKLCQKFCALCQKLCATKGGLARTTPKVHSDRDSDSFTRPRFVVSSTTLDQNLSSKMPPIL